MKCRTLKYKMSKKQNEKEQSGMKLKLNNPRIRRTIEISWKKLLNNGFNKMIIDVINGSD